MYRILNVDTNNVGAYPPARPAVPFGRVPIRAGCYTPLRSGIKPPKA